MPAIAIVDSGSANLGSVQRALEKVGARAVVTDNPFVISRSPGVIFPGVGAFETAMTKLRQKALQEPLADYIRTGRPFLGICLGLQLLFSSSEERNNFDDPPVRGLNVFPGTVRRFPRGMTVPHVGWNRVTMCRSHPLFRGLPEGTYFYFTHSYYVEAANREDVVGLTTYGSPFPSAVSKGFLMGVQFHPEKSGPAGLRLLQNFDNIIADHIRNTGH